MKIPRSIIHLPVWLALLGHLAAQPARPGEPTNLNTTFGAGPGSPANMFGQPTLPQPLSVGAPVSTNATTGMPVNNLNGSLPSIGNLTVPPAASNTTAPSPNATANATAASPAPAATNVASNGPDLTNFPMPATPANIDNEHQIAVGDQIALQIVEDQEPPKLLLVAEDGTITIPWTNKPMNVANATLYATAQELQKYLSNTTLNFYKDGHPTILAAYYHSDHSRGRIYINGAVQNPGFVSIPLDRILTFQDVIQAAHGFRGDADLTKISITHTTNKPALSAVASSATGNATTVTPAAADVPPDNITFLNMEDMLKNNQVPDMPMKPGDFITVPSKVDVSAGYVIVSGDGVNRPGTVPLTPQTRLVSQIVLLSGYDTKFADIAHVKLIRNIVDPKTGKTEQKAWVVNVDEIINKGIITTDRELQNGDFVIVKDNIFGF